MSTHFDPTLYKHCSSVNELLEIGAAEIEGRAAILAALDEEERVEKEKVDRERVSNARSKLPGALHPYVRIHDQRVAIMVPETYPVYINTRRSFDGSPWYYLDTPGLAAEYKSQVDQHPLYMLALSARAWHEDERNRKAAPAPAPAPAPPPPSQAEEALSLIKQLIQIAMNDFNEEV